MKVFRIRCWFAVAKDKLRNLQWQKVDLSFFTLAVGDEGNVSFFLTLCVVHKSLIGSFRIAG